MNERYTYSSNIDAVDIPTKTLQFMYVTMLKIHRFEEKAAELVSKKEIICPCHLYIGEEAIKNINSSGEN